MPLSAMRAAVAFAASFLVVGAFPVEAAAGESATVARHSSSPVRTWHEDARRERVSLRARASLRRESVLEIPGTYLQEMEEKPSVSEWRSRIKHEIASGFVFMSCLVVLCCVIMPITIWHRQRWAGFASDEDSFIEYGQYRFFNWFSRSQTAPIIVVISITLFVVVIGAILYALFVGGTPSQAMFKVFVWASASSADTETSVGGRLLGVVVTVFGLIILALLLSMVTEAFNAKMNQVKMGLNNVCEGGHVVLLGFSAAVKTLLEEMSAAWETEGGVIFVILSEQPKVDVEEQLLRMGISQKIRNSRVIVRSGNASSFHALKQVAADKASKILSLMDHTLTPEEALAKQIRTMLALKSKAWPINGSIVVQVATEGDMQLIKSLYPDTDSTTVEVVVIGDIVAKLMVQSAWEHGLAGVFGMMLGFEGDEFYFKEFPQLLGKTFLEAYFRIPDAVVLGIYRKDGTCLLNPGWDYKIQKNDELIVLAEDDDTFDVEDKPYFDFTQNPSATVSPGRYQPKRSSRGVRNSPITDPSSALIIGWNHNIGKLLATIDSTFPAGSDVTIFADVPQDVRDKTFARLREDDSSTDLRHGVGVAEDNTKLWNLTIKHEVVDTEDMTRRSKLAKLNHGNARAIFMLADTVVEGDDTNVAVLAQLQYIGRTLESKFDFDPVVEMCENSTIDHLKVAELDNLIHSSSLISQALAAVTYDPKVNKVYTEFFSKVENGFAIARLEEYTVDHQMPKTISFAEAAFLVRHQSQTIIVGWTEIDPETKERVWCLNPKDKTQRRQWDDKDRVCVITKIEAGAATPRHVDVG